MSVPTRARTPARPRPVRAWRSALERLLVVASIGVAGPSRPPGGDDLAHILRAAKPGAERELERGVAALLPAAIPDVLEVLASGTVPDATPAARLTPADELALMRALASARDATHAKLRELAGSGARVELRIACLRVLCETGGGEQLALALHLAPATPDSKLVEPEVRGTLEEALARILHREPQALATLEGLLPGAHPALLQPVLASIGRHPRASEALSTLLRTLGRVPEADPLAMLEIQRFGEGVAYSVDERLVARLRPYLWRQEANLFTPAVRTLGDWRDEPSVAEMIELLDERSEPEQALLLQALRRVSKQRLPADYAAWRKWYDLELDWWQRVAPVTLERVASRDPKVASPAIRSLAEHKLHRDELAAALLPSLERREWEIVRMACAVLKHLESRVPLAHLVRCLEHADAGVRKIAWKALCEITGASLPMDPEAWNDLLHE